MRKPAKKGSKAPVEEATFPAGRAWERIEQFRIARGLQSPIQPASTKPTKAGRPTKKRAPTKSK